MGILAYFITAILLLASLCYFNKTVRFHIKNICFLLIFLVIGFVVCVKSFTRPGDVRNMKWWRYAQHFVRTFTLFNMEIKSENLEVLNTEESCVIVSNHQSEMDQMALVDVWNHIGGTCTILAKESIKYMGTLGLGCLFSGVVFVDRKNREKSRKCMQEVVRRMQEEKLKLWLYPEGTRTMNMDIDMREFKKGAFHMAIQAQVPIVPVVMSCYKHMYNIKTQTFNKVTINLIGLPAFETKGLTEDDVPELIHKVRESMLATYRKTVPVGINNVENESTVSNRKANEMNGTKIMEREQ
ncbi:1-acyl-sn-glycerol-3-phosphate acyltransferase beta-like [Antedon mediterranea]|uniref:1-acyl-sn-glycerol-3-phosphate acyltransferase beta-like n=1 Tax=Antedon mediterranea TaxID=105859 RepID=UPI003AF96AA5